jgi:hypothetical protein
MREVRRRFLVLWKRKRKKKTENRVVAEQDKQNKVNQSILTRKGKTIVTFDDQ